MSVISLLWCRLWDLIFLAAPAHLHEALNLSAGKSGLLFVHDTSGPDIESSIRCLHRHIELLLHYGGRGVFVIVNSAYRTDAGSQSQELAARFEAELHGYAEDFGKRVLVMPVADGYRVAAETLLSFPLFWPKLWAAQHAPEKQEQEAQDFWHAFLTGKVTQWRHRDYLRAAYMTLLDPANKDMGLLEVATQFAAAVDSFKRRNEDFQSEPESR